MVIHEAAVILVSVIITQSHLNSTSHSRSNTFLLTWRGDHPRSVLKQQHSVNRLFCDPYQNFLRIKMIQCFALSGYTHKHSFNPFLSISLLHEGKDKWKNIEIGCFEITDLGKCSFSLKLLCLLITHKPFSCSVYHIWS